MALQYSTALRNAQLDQIEAVGGTAVLIRIYSGSMPADAGTAASGTKLVEITGPSDWMGNAASGVKSKSGTWQVNAVATGTAGYFRIYDSGGTVCLMQGTVTVTGGGGDMTLDNTSIASGQQVTVSTFSITAGNA